MLAIIIPYFKLNFFEATLESLANQTDKRFKVYIGDDSSPEDPVVLLEKYQNKFDFVYHYFDNNLGGTSLTKQWERCIALSENEEWIMILGDDDVPSNNVVALFYKNLESSITESINVIRFSTVIINSKGEKQSSIFEHPKLESSIDFLCRKFSKKTRSSLSEYIFRKEKMIEKTFRDFPLAWHSDDMAVLEFSDFGNCISVNEACMEVRVSDTSITGISNLNDLKNKTTFEFCEVLFKEYSGKFSNQQKKIILKKLEIAFLNIRSFNYYRILSSYYYNQLGIIEAIYFQIHFLRIGLILILKKIKLFHFVHKIYSKIKK